jgi:hypothetical protein
MQLLRKTYRLQALFLAVLMLATSLGFSIDMHFCQGRLMSASVFGKAKSCVEMADPGSTQSCAMHSSARHSFPEPVFNQAPCCQQHTLSLQAEQDLQLQQVGTLDAPQTSVYLDLAQIVEFSLPSLIDPAQPAAYTYYRPPLIQRDIQVLFQSFLI